ncbi:STAS domain-containing protein [Paracoccus sanguinis]|uniref:STAS domain-containing protein n=1 Tax=Paracoccus sanguinis TaxID=1545044 RepID=UPI0009DD5C61|nr:STAS domain-containing protein [Paracoccus sanguinis]
MGFTIEDLADGVLVRVLDARLDAAQAIRFKDRLREVVARDGPRIVLDLSRVEFMDSSGLGAILAIRRGLPATHQLEVAALGPNVDRVFQLTRMDTVFTIHKAAPPATPRPAPSRPAPAEAGAAAAAQGGAA